MAAIVTVILMGSIWAITSLMADMVNSEFARSAEAANFDINKRAAAGIRERIYNIRSEALLLLDLETALNNSAAQTQQIRTLFFERNPGIAAVFVQNAQEIINLLFLNNNHIAPEALKAWIAAEQEAVSQAKKGVPSFKNASPALGINLLALVYPWQGTGAELAVVIFFSPENLAEISGTGSSSTFVINGDGDILVHPDFNKVLEGVNVVNNALVDSLRKAPGESIRLDYTEDGNRFIAAGHRIPFADTAVFSTMEYSLVAEQIDAVTRRNIYLSITVMFFTILITWLFSRTIISPIKKLTAAAARIENGEFDLNLVSKSRDEIGVLTNQFIKMSQGLSKWVDSKNLAGRLNNQDILGKVMKDEINLKGDYIKTVVLSVDLVNLNEITASLDASQSLEQMNNFISIISGIIEKNSGIVDKILGNRLIAVWGFASEQEQNISGLVMNSISSVVSMRSAFWDLNTEREAANLPPFRMGCGIHTGEVLAGSFGPPGKGIYTVAGRTVDEAIETGKACLGAELDIILTSDVYELAGDLIIAEEITPKQTKKDKKKAQGKNASDAEDSDSTAAETAERALFGLINLAPQDREKPHWPFTLDDVKESLRKRAAVKNSGKKSGKTAE